MNKIKNKKDNIFTSFTDPEANMNFFNRANTTNFSSTSAVSEEIDYNKLTFICPICNQESLVSFDKNKSIYNIDYNDLFECEECGARLYAMPQEDGEIKFINNNKD